MKRLVLHCIQSERQMEDVCDGARLRGWLNGPKMVILLYLQVNGKYLSVIPHHSFSVRIPVQSGVGELGNNGKSLSAMLCIGSVRS